MLFVSELLLRIEGLEKKEEEEEEEDRIDALVAISQGDKEVHRCRLSMVILFRAVEESIYVWIALLHIMLLPVSLFARELSSSAERRWQNDNDGDKDDDDVGDDAVGCWLALLVACFVLTNKDRIIVCYFSCE